MPRPRPLRPGEAARTLAHRLSPRVDRLRQFSTKFGLRSTRVYLVWSKYTGGERGEGREQIIRRLELLPTPRVSELTSISQLPFAAGTLPVGAIRVDLITAQLSDDTLTGRTLPAAEDGANVHIKEPYDFYWELVEDDRVDKISSRGKFRVLGNPTRREGNVSWTVVLERVSEDTRRTDAQSNYLEDE